MKKLFTLLSLAALASTAGAQCITSAWTYSTPVNVYNPNSSTLTDHQVVLTVNTAALVSAGHMQADGDDIRFTDGTCCANLCYVIESGMNTASTRIWVKVPSMGPLSNTSIQMVYGNPSATAGANPNCTWDMWEPFDNTVNHFSSVCGSGTYTVSGGSATISWGSNFVLRSDVVFPVGTVYTAESNMVTASGNWPGINWSRDLAGNHFGYSILLGSGVRIGKSGSTASDYCRGENWASPVYTTPGSVAGIWGITWIATGSSTAVFPGLGTITSTDTEHARSSDLRVCIGGISGGTGSMQLDWLRVRKYAVNDPLCTPFTETTLSFASASLGSNVDACDGSTVVLNPVGSFLTYSWSDASTDSTLAVTASGDYAVTVTAGAGACPGADTVTVTFLPPISLSLPDTVHYCEGSSTTVNADPGYASYDWSNGDVTAAATVSLPGTLNLVVTDSIGCQGFDSLYAIEDPAPVSLLDDSVWVCPGDSALLDAGPGFSSYLWSTGDTSMTVTVPAPGSYTVTVTDALGCEGTALVGVGFDAVPVPAFTYTTSGGGFTYNFTYTGSPSASYFWDFGDGGTSTSANPAHTFASDSAYIVCVTATNALTGCTADTCMTILIVAQSGTASLSQLSVYPNPAHSSATVGFTASVSGPVQVELCDLRGAVLSTLSGQAVAGQAMRVEIPLHELAPSLYLLRVSTPEGVQIVRLAVE